jgi:6-phosphogluconolactonase
VTLTPVAINAAAEVVFLVSGREKAPALRDVLLGPPDPVQWPAQAVVLHDRRPRWLIDAAAAVSLPNSPAAFPRPQRSG